MVGWPPPLGPVGGAPSASEAPSPAQVSALLPGIVDYMIEQSGPPSKQILALKQVQEFLKDRDDVIIIGIFKSESDPAYQLYQDAGEKGSQASTYLPRPSGVAAVA